EIFLPIILSIIGISFIVLLRKIEFLSKYLHLSLGDKSTEKSIITPYDKLDRVSLEKIVDKLSSSFTILITIYGLLFTFIISQHFGLIFTHWTVISWTGWILAIIVRSASTALELSDIVERSSMDNKLLLKTARKIYAIKMYYKHTIFLLIPAI